MGFAIITALACVENENSKSEEKRSGPADTADETDGAPDTGEVSDTTSSNESADTATDSTVSEPENGRQDINVADVTACIIYGDRQEQGFGGVLDYFEMTTSSRSMSAKPDSVDTADTGTGVDTADTAGTAEATNVLAVGSPGSRKPEVTVMDARGFRECVGTDAVTAEADTVKTIRGEGDSDFASGTVAVGESQGGLNVPGYYVVTAPGYDGNSGAVYATPADGEVNPEISPDSYFARGNTAGNYLGNAVISLPPLTGDGFGNVILTYNGDGTTHSGIQVYLGSELAGAGFVGVVGPSTSVILDSPTDEPHIAYHENPFDDGKNYVTLTDPAAGAMGAGKIYIVDADRFGWIISETTPDEIAEIVIEADDPNIHSLGESVVFADPDGDGIKNLVYTYRDFRDDYVTKIGALQIDPSVSVKYTSFANTYQTYLPEPEIHRADLDNIPGDEIILSSPSDNGENGSVTIARGDVWDDNVGASIEDFAALQLFGENQERMGAAVTFQDLNGDGYPDIVVGSPKADGPESGQVDFGSVRILDGDVIRESLNQ